jgi:hypothetical protein
LPQNNVLRSLHYRAGRASININDAEQNSQTTRTMRLTGINAGAVVFR